MKNITFCQQNKYFIFKFYRWKTIFGLSFLLNTDLSFFKFGFIIQLFFCRFEILVK